MVITYTSTGRVAVDIKEDGTGFIYYPNGSVAVCCSQASEYQNSFYAFDKDNNVLMTMGAKGIGYCQSSKRKSTDSNGISIVLTAKGSVVTDDSGKILYDWKWDREALNPGVEPPDTITIRMNDNLEFRFKNRTSMSLEFNCENVQKVIEVGVKVKRSTNYLTNAKRGLDGKLFPKIEPVTLKDRQNEFNLTMRAQRNKLHPKSENLSEMVKEVVAKLENDFSGIEDALSSTPYLESTWKTDALSKTVREIPRIPIEGHETGLFRGFGDKIYIPKEEFTGSKLPEHMLTKTGQIKGELELRNALMKLNPPIKRSAALHSASGRYSTMLVVNKNLVSATNPTGMIVPTGLPLEYLNWESLKPKILESKGELIVCLVYRSGDPICVAYQQVAELVNRRIANNEGIESLKLSGSFRMVAVDVNEDGNVMSDLGLKSLPTFVMFGYGNILYAGSLGGRRVRTKFSTNPQILIIEPSAADQIKTEKTLKRLGCDTFLCLSANEAVTRVQKMCLNQVNDGPPNIVFDLIIISEEIQSNEIVMLEKLLSDYLKSKRSILCIMKRVFAGTSVAAQLDISTVPPPLSTITNRVIQKPVKAIAIEKLLEERIIPPEDVNLGLTEKSLMLKMQSVYSEITRGARSAPLSFNGENKTNVPYIGICLCAEDVKIKNGRALVVKNNNYTAV